MTDSSCATDPSRDPAAGDRFGDILARFVPLTRHDVYEILEEQSQSRKRFGQIAIQLGLCEPTHVWQAWSAQLLGRTPRVDLAKFGIDAQAAADVPAWLASALGVVPIRSTGDRLVIAATDQSLARAIEVLTAQATKPLSFVLADADQVAEAIRRYYMLSPTKNDNHACAGKRCGAKCRGDECPARHRPISAHIETLSPDMTYV